MSSTDKVDQSRLKNKRKVKWKETRADLLIALLVVSSLEIEVLAAMSFYSNGILMPLFQKYLPARFSISVCSDILRDRVFERNISRRNQVCSGLHSFRRDFGTKRGRAVSKSAKIYIVFCCI